MAKTDNLRAEAERRLRAVQLMDDGLITLAGAIPVCAQMVKEAVAAERERLNTCCHANTGCPHGCHGDAIRSERLRKDDTPEGKAIWDAVDKAAARAPEWVRNESKPAEEMERPISSCCGCSGSCRCNCHD